MMPLTNALRGPIVVQKYGGTSVGTPERIQSIAARVARGLHQRTERVALVVSAMAGETNRLVDLVRQVNPGAAAKTYDMVVAAGEQVSVGLMTAALERAGLRSEPLLGYQIGIVTDELHARARIQSIDVAKIHALWDAGVVPVVAGFQGVTSRGEITTLGRGGSDTSAVALAAALRASFCEINTDVDGVYTADPRVVKTARLIDRLDYEVALELAALGSKVLHSRCVELGAKYRMPIVVRSTFDPDDARRTEIMAFTEKDALESPVVSGVTLDRAVVKCTVRGLPAETRAVATLFSEVAKAGVNVDIIVQDRAKQAKVMDVGFTVGSGDVELSRRAVESARQAAGWADVEFDKASALSKVSAVGLGMRSHPGVAARMFEALGAEGIEILMTSTSEIKISCVINEADGERATRRLHALFFES